MGFSLPKLPNLDFASELSKLTETFDPSSAIGAISDNVKSQQSNIENVRSQLESARQSVQEASAKADLKTLQEYTAGLQSMADATSVFSSAKPALTPMTPDSLKNPLGNSSTDGISTEVIGLVCPEAAVAIEGAKVLSAGAKTLKDDVLPVVEEQMNSGVLSDITGSDTFSNILGSDVVSSISNITKSLSKENVLKATSDSILGGITSVTNALPLSEDLSKTLTDTIMSDKTGKMLESTIEQTCSLVIDKISDGDSLDSITPNDLVRMADKISSSYNTSGYKGTIGGINFSNTSSLKSGLELLGLDSSINSGDVQSMANLAGSLIDIVPKETLVKKIDEAAPNVNETQSDVDAFMRLRNVLSDGNDVLPQAKDTAIDLTDNVLSSGGRIAEKVYGTEMVNKANALVNVAKLFK